jgi:hypothetical protein
LSSLSHRETKSWSKIPGIPRKQWLTVLEIEHLFDIDQNIHCRFLYFEMEIIGTRQEVFDNIWKAIIL